MTFEKMWSLVEEINGLERDAEELRDRWDDWGAMPGCECGCGGDTFDWDGQSEAFHEANQLDREAFELREKIRLAWEAMCDAEGSNS